MTDSVIEFLDTLAPFWDLARDIFSFRIFGAPLYGLLVSLFMISFVLSFIKGARVGSGIGSAISAGIRTGEAAKAERQAKERSARIGFRPRED